MADRPIFGLGLCAGGLGLELGLETAIAGYRTVCMVEREISVCGRIAARIEEGSIPELACWDDVTTFDGKPWCGIVSIVSAGFPCQPFSVAGKRKGTGDERWIWPDIARIIGEVAPEIVFLENVPGLLLDPDSDTDRFSMDEQPDDALGGMATVLRDLAGLGFDAEWMCLRASDVGASHGRRRVFILAYSERARRDGRTWAGILGNGSPLQAARSGNGNGPMADTGCAGIGRASEPAGFDGRGASDDDSGTGGTLGHARRGSTRRIQPELERECGGTSTPENSIGIVVNAECSERGPGAIGTGCNSAGFDGEGETSSGVGNGEPVLADSAGERLQIRRDDSGVRECPATERAGSELGDSESGRLGELREPSESIGQSDGAIVDVEHASRHGELRQEGETGWGRGRGICASGEQLGNAESSGLETRHADESGTSQGFANFGDGVNDLAIFAPGPTDPRWEDLLVSRPWLRPSWSQAEAQSYFHELAHGMAALVAGERTGALRALGNGCVPLQVAYAFTILARRAGLI